MMKLGMKVGLGPDHIVLDGDPALPPPKKRGRGAQPPILVHVRCGQTAGWIKIPLGVEVDLGPGVFVLDGDPVPPKKGHSPQFSAYVCCGQTVTHLSYCYALVTVAPKPSFLCIYVSLYLYIYVCFLRVPSL